MTGDLVVFSLASGEAFARRVCAHLGCEPAAREERDFEDGEHKTRPLEPVRGRDVFVVQSLHGEPGASANDKLCRLLFFLGALRDAGAGRVTAVVPYLCYARKDRKTKARDPVTTRYVAALFEAVGIDAIVTVDVHNLAAFQNAFRVQSENLEARPLLAAHVARRVGRAEVVVVAPDAGGVHRAEAFRRTLERRLGRPVAAAFAEKRRSEGVVSGSLFAGDVRDRAAVIVDDLVAGGSTLQRTAAACRERGASAVLAVATHGAFTGGASAALTSSALDGLAVTDTILPLRLTPEAGERVTTIELSGLVAEAIRRMHGGGSLVELLELPPG